MRLPHQDSIEAANEKEKRGPAEGSAFAPRRLSARFESRGFSVRGLENVIAADALDVRVREGARLGQDAGLAAGERRLGLLGPSALQALRADAAQALGLV